MQLSRNRVLIDLAALGHNLNQVRSLLRPGTRIMGVVKADAYGHGLVPVSRTLMQMGVESLGVAHLHEAMELRRKGIDLPVFILSGIQTKEEARAVIESKLSPVIYDLSVAAAMADECARLGTRMGVHVKVDTGMGRLGVSHLELAAFLNKMTSFKPLTVEGLISHLSSADDPDAEFTEGQIRDFKKSIEQARAAGLALPLNSLSNSAGVMVHGGAHFEVVRPGIMLYGGLPCPNFRSPVLLKPVMNLQGMVLQVRDMPEGVPISYSRTYHTRGEQKIAVLSAGYGDGLPRGLSNRGKVLIRGKKCQIVGRVCMNLTMADVSGFKDIQPGDDAVFLGCQEGECIAGDDIAQWAGTISYEVFCSIGQGGKREYVS
jgi:alanine racemase